MSESVYRVFEAFHDSSESGTEEYGVYSTIGKARARCEAVWKQKGYPIPETFDNHGMYAYHQMDTYNIRITPITLDADKEIKLVGYT